MNQSKYENTLGAAGTARRSIPCCAILLALGLALAALPAWGQDDEKPSGERPERGRPEGERPERGRGERPLAGAGGWGLMRALDLNGDRELDGAEIDMAVVSLRKLDRNGDGKISGAELGGAPRGEGASQPGNNPGRARLDFAKLDKDGDGKISKEEAPEGMRERFDRMDRNGDGFIDKEEQEAVMKFIRQRMRDGGGQGRGRDRGAGEGGSERPKRPPVEEG